MTVEAKYDFSFLFSQQNLMLSFSGGKNEKSILTFSRNVKFQPGKMNIFIELQLRGKGLKNL
jgi:hypothetical protein